MTWDRYHQVRPWAPPCACCHSWGNRLPESLPEHESCPCLHCMEEQACSKGCLIKRTTIPPTFSWRQVYRPSPLGCAALVSGFPPERCMAIHVRLQPQAGRQTHLAWDYG